MGSPLATAGVCEASISYHGMSGHSRSYRIAAEHTICCNYEIVMDTFVSSRVVELIEIVVSDTIEENREGLFMKIQNGG